MSSPHDPEELIARLAAEDSSTTGPEDATLAPLRAELETIESQIRQPRPAEPLLEESAYQRAAAQVVELGRELSHATRQQLEQPAPDQPPLGELGHYKLLEKLGEGGMGAVYKAVHTRLKRVVALKVLPKERLQDDQAVARFQREMWAVGTLQHPNIVAAHDAGEIDGMHYLVMELVEGIDLARLVSERGPLPINAACELIRQAAQGLQHAYEHNLVHRDIKPSNLMLAAPANSKGSPTVKILDLGLALLDGNQIDAGELTSTGQVMGTLDYMAPEQGTDTHGVDIRADIYSLGASLYKLLTGRAPFGDPQYNSPIKKLMALANQAPKPVESLRPDCPPVLAQLIARMLAKSPEERPTPPEELATALEPFAQGADLHALLKPRDAAQVSTVNRHEHTVRTQHTADDPTFVPTGPVDASSPTRLATTQISQPPARSKRRVVLGLGGVAAALVMGVIIAIATDQGTVEIKAPDDLAEQIQIKLLRDGQELKPSWQIKAGTGKVTTVRSGNVSITLPDDHNEYEVVGPDQLVVRRGKTVVFELRRREARPDVSAITQKSQPREASPPLAFKTPGFDKWVKEVANLAPAKQADRVIQKLVELNPDFDGMVETNVSEWGVWRLKFHTDHVTDISPIRALSELRVLDATGENLLGTWPRLRGTGKLSDLSPLKGLELTYLEVGRNPELSDLSPVAGMPLTTCHCEYTRVSDLEPLRGMKLQQTAYGGTRISDVSPLKGMPITYLVLSSTEVSDLSPLAGMPLKTLGCSGTLVSRLDPLAGAPLESLDCHDTQISDLSPLKGMPLKTLGCIRTSVTDLSPLEGLPLETLIFNPANVTRGIQVVRGMKSLRTLSVNPEPQWHLPADEFWKKLDAGEFDKPEMRSPRGGDRKLFPEPPSLADWLKGRTVLTVAQDGSGKFKTIQDALDALKPGQVVRVLDKGPYDERLDLHPTPSDVGLISEAGTIIELRELKPAGWKNGGVDLYEGHFLADLDGFRLSGFHFVFPDAKELIHLPGGFVCGGLKIDRPDGLVVENCRFEGRCTSIYWDSLTLLFKAGGSARPVCIRDCVIEAGLRLDASAEPRPTLIARNYFWKLGDAPDRPNLKFFGPEFGKLVVRENICDGQQNGLDLDIGVVARFDSLEVSNNTFNSLKPIVFDGDCPTGAIAIQNNLCTKPGVIEFWNVKPEQIEGAVKTWRVGHNAYPRPVDSGFPPREGDISARETLLSYDRESRDYFRLPVNAASATAGAGGALPKYIGALTPGPAPAGGDWFTWLRQQWLGLDSSEAAPERIAEPPPLAEWLKGRTVLTVAQDGSGEFKTIQAALNALQTGQVVKVLDRGPYRERLELHSPPADIGLISEVETRIEILEYVPGTADGQKMGHFLMGLDRFRFHGLEFLLPQAPAEQVTLGMHIWQPQGVVFENCAVRCPRSPSSQSLVFGAVRGNPDQANVIRECLIENRMQVYSLEPSGSAVVTRNYFAGIGGLATIGAFRSCIVHHNIFAASSTLGFDLAVVHADSFALSNNTFLSTPGAVAMNTSGARLLHEAALRRLKGETDPQPAIDRGPTPTGHGVIYNNLHNRPGFLNVTGGGEQDAWTWDIGYNCYPGDGEIAAANALPRPTNTLANPIFYSILPEDRNYARLKPDSPGASSGAGGKFAKYAGALPPGPAPQAGDWFTRLQEKWMGLPVASTATETRPLAFKTPEFERWAKEVAELAAPQQVQRVSQKLVELNPEFDGELEPQIEAGMVSRLKFHTDHVTDISPVRALPGLRILDATGEKLIGDWPLVIGTGKLSDLSPLKGLKLEVLEVGRNPALSDLAPVAGMQLRVCHCEFTSVSSLEPLRGMQLKETAYSGTRVADISPLKGMPITYLLLTGTQVSELSALAGMPLKTLAFDDTRVSDLAPLKGMPLESLNFGHTAIADLAPLKGMRLRTLSFHKSRVADLSPLHGMPLKSLGCLLTPVSDLTPLEGMELEKLTFTPANVTRGIDILRGMKSLRTIGAGYEPQWNWPPEEFWKKYDAGEFGKPEMPPSGNKVSDKPVEIPEPPSLADWLKGRTVLTVAQDSSGQFKSIQAALDALKKGQVVKVLDRGPYREQLIVTGLPPDSALISEVRTIIELPQASRRPDGSTYGHLMRVTHGFRIHGIGFDSPPIQNGQGIVLEECDGLILENCQFRVPTSDQILSATIDIVSGVNGLDRPLVIRDCRFDGPLRFENVKPVDRDVLITRNYFTAESYGTPIALGGTFRKLAVRHNIFEGKTATQLSVWDTEHSERIEISHNTLVGNGAVMLQKSVPENVTFIGNLFAGHSCITIAKDLSAERVGSWETDRNYYQGHMEFADLERVPIGPTDRVMPFRFLSKPPGTRDYARLRKPVSGGKDEIPEGVGALPTGPAPEAGDWFTRLQESWFEEPGK